MATVLGEAASKGIIAQAFASVFRGLNVSVEKQYQRLRLKTTVANTYAEYIIRNVGTFPLFATTKEASVESAYVRVGLSSRLERERYKRHADIEEQLRLQQSGKTADPVRHAASKTLIEVLDGFSAAIALLGNPGSGKTTTMRHAAVTLAKGTRVGGKRRIPLFLPVRDLAVQAQSIEEAAIRFLERLSVAEPVSVFRALLQSGEIAILLDGIDEADQALQKELFTEIVGLKQDYENAVVCVSGRPFTLSRSLPGFQKWETLPLASDERTALVRTWYDSVDPEKGTRLLEDCADNPGLLDLGTNPLLLAIVCALYYNDLKIPSEPDELYARSVEGLLGAWDAFRSIARQTPLRDLTVRRRIVLVSWIAAAMFERGRLVFGSGNVDDARVTQRFAESTHTPAVPTDELLASLYNDFGILVERAPGLFSFSHLTFQEYLAAQYTVDNRREIDLLSHRQNEAWREVIRLVAKMLPKADMYMAALTDGTDLTKVGDIKLLTSAWAMHPICEPFELGRAMRVVAEKIRAYVLSLSATYKIKDGRVVARLTGKDSRKHRDVDLASFDVLRNIPSILELFRVTGVSLRDLELHDLEPFSLIETGVTAPIHVTDS